MRVPDAVKGMQVSYVDGIPPEAEAMKAALRKLAESDAKMVISFGGQTDEAVQRVAWEFPEQRFTVIQGSLLRPNLAAYEVLQEQSAFLAGAAAGMLTKTNVVGHMSGLRVRPGLKARAAFAGGLAATNPRRSCSRTSRARRTTRRSRSGSRSPRSTPAPTSSSRC